MFKLTRNIWLYPSEGWAIYKIDNDGPTAQEYLWNWKFWRWERYTGTILDDEHRLFKRKSDDQELRLDEIGKSEGLQKRFFVGQQIPWDGIWFSVTKVEKENIQIAPIRTTWQRQKKLKKMKEGGR